MGSKSTLAKEPMLKFLDKEVYNEYTRIDGKEFAVIHNVDEMRPFFMSIVSATDLWLFVSSNGGISSGRINADNSIFPYDTDDKITDNIEITGSKTIIKYEGKFGNHFPTGTKDYIEQLEIFIKVILGIP